MAIPGSGKRRGAWLQLGVKIVVMIALLATIIGVMYSLSQSYRTPPQPLQPQQPAAITIVADPQVPAGVVFGFEGQRYTDLQELAAALAVRARTNPRAIVDPDGDAPWGSVVDVMDLAEKSGFKDVQLSRTSETAPATAP